MSHGDNWYVPSLRRITAEDKINTLVRLGFGVTIKMGKIKAFVETQRYINNTYYTNSQEGPTLDAALDLVAKRNNSPVRIEYE